MTGHSGQKGSTMTALLTLEPRNAGTEVIEPDVPFADSFAETEDDLHDSGRCFITMICHKHSDICTITE
jgi:hypothetical protein